MSDQDNLVIEDGFVPDPEVMQQLEDDAKLEANTSGATETPPEKVPEPTKEPDEKEPETTEEPEASAETDTPKAEGIEITLGGETKHYKAHEIKSALGRQRKLDELMKSDEYKMGKLMKAAQDGDSKAQKKLQGLLVGFTGAEDAEGMVDKLEDVEGEFNEDEKVQEEVKQADFDVVFDDVKDDVDFKDNLAKIDTDLKAVIPKKIFESYIANPEAKRVMYDLVASGRAESLISAFNAEIDQLPLEKRLDIQTDPDLYASEFTRVVRSVNAKEQASNKEEPAKTEESDSDLDAVSKGGTARTQPKTSSEPDFDSMTTEEFNKYAAKHGIAPI